jgi:hypothetical protein
MTEVLASGAELMILGLLVWYLAELIGDDDDNNGYGV